MSRNSSTGPSGILPRAVRLMRCEERDGRVTPIVNATWRAILRIKLKHGKKFDSRDSQVLEIRNLLDESAKSAACLFRDHPSSDVA